MNEYELYHHGVKGQRWGIRRYQNKDGTLTKAGQKRYDKEMEKLKKEERVLKNKQRTAAKLEKLESKRKEVESLKSKSSDKESNTKPDTKLKKTVKDLSDEELRAKISRIELEKKYSDLTRVENKKKTSKGKAFINETLEKSGKNIAGQLVTYMMGTAVNKALKGVFDDDAIVNPKKGQKDK